MSENAQHHAGVGADPTTWTDLLIRNSTSDTGQIPALGALSSSPDLIPYGTTPAPDPTAFLANMGQDFGKDVVQDELNYFYARGVNLSAGAESGTVHLYWTKASLICWPGKWTNNELLQETGTKGSPVSASAQGSNFVTEAPLVWTPGAIDPSDHYCLIGRVVTSVNPNPLPTMLEMPDFAAWVAGNRGMSWRNLALVTDPSPPEYTVTVDYSQGATGETVYVVLDCVNVPNGCDVAFTCGTPGPDPLMTMPKTQITSFPSQVLGISTSVPANWESNVTYSLWSNGHQLPADAAITLTPWYLPPVESELAEIAGADFRDVGLPLEMWHDEDAARAEVGPVPAVCLGQHSMVWSG